MKPLRKPVRLLVGLLPWVLPAVGVAGPNLLAIGNYGELPLRRAEGRNSLSGDEIVYQFDDPRYDFGRIVVRTDQAQSVVRRDLFVGFNGSSLIVDTRGNQGGGGTAQIKELEIWLKIKGRIRPNRSYEWEMQGGGSQVIQGGVPAVMPVLWADGEQLGAEVIMRTPQQIKEDRQGDSDDDDDDDRIRRLLFPHGVVHIKDFKRQTSGAWLVLQPANYGQYFALSRFSFREVEDEASVRGSAMPTPIRYIPIKNQLAGQLERAMVSGSQALRRQQSADGFWNVGNPEESVYTTALIVSALAESDPDTERLSEALEWLSKQEQSEDAPWSVRTTAQRLYCLARYGGIEDYSRAIYTDVQSLNQAQLDDGGWMATVAQGAAGRGAPPRSDNDNSLQVLIALREAQFAGARIEKRIWRRVLQYWTEAQADNGGFRQQQERYGGLGQATTTTYTAAGTGALIAALDMASGVETANCRRYLASKKQLRGIDAGLGWLNRNYGESMRNVGSFVSGADPFAKARNLQLLGAISGISHFNDKNYYLESAQQIIEGFDPASGMFGVRGQQGGWAQAPSLPQTAQAMLSLGRGGAPTVVQRIILGDNERRWGEYSGNVTHLVRYLAAKRGRQFNWRRTTIDRETRELIEVPFLVLAVVGPFEWLEEQWSKIREYCFAGGTVIVDIAETKDRDTLHKSVVEGLSLAFPEYQLSELDEDHPIYSAEVEMKKPAGLQALGNGFRTFLFVPQNGWSCQWQTFQPNEEDEAFVFMNNLLSYATDGTPLRSSFASSTYAIGSASTESMTAAYFEVGREAPAYPNALETMNRLMQSNYRVRVERVTGSKQPHITWICVTGDDAPSDAVKEQLRTAINGNGMLFVDVVSGNEDWDEGFRAALQSLSGDLHFEKMRRTNPVYTGEIAGTQGYDVVDVELRKPLQNRFSDWGRCDLYQIRHKGKPIGVYSAYDLSSGAGYHYFPECRGVMPEYARRILVNVFLTAYEWKVNGRPGL